MRKSLNTILLFLFFFVYTEGSRGREKEILTLPLKQDENQHVLVLMSHVKISLKQGPLVSA